MKNLIFLILLPLAISCNTGRSIKDKDLLPGNAEWIGDGIRLPEYDSLFYLDDPSPLFRKEFSAGSEIESATIYITAAGYYQASINGEKIGENQLDPAWTNFKKRIYFTGYDITDKLDDGLNCLGVSLGNGFYNPLPMKMWGGRNIRLDLPVGRPVFIAKLHIKNKNGSEIEILTDITWKYTSGPLTRNNVYLGEVYDARNEIEKWDSPGFDDSLWLNASVSTGPGGVLQESFFPAIQVRDKKTPLAITEVGKGIYIVDMGVNFSGDYNIRLKGETGDTISFRFGERIYDNGELNPMTTVCGQIKREGMGGPGAPDIAWQTDSYIFGNKNDIWYNPVFTFHTYRYMEISGLNYKPAIEDIQGLSFHTNVENKNSFECSSELLNSIQIATERTFLANLISVQSDCPAREKFGYGGDLNATSESFIYNFDMQSFYRKTIYDWVDAINDTVFIDTAPYVGIAYCGLSWESAMLITQYYMYLYYNDIELIRELYELDKKWMDKAARIHPDGIVDKGLADHEALESVPVQLTGTGHYLQCARIMETFAVVMNDKTGEAKYRSLADDIQKKIKTMFWEEETFDNINKQTLYSTLLFHDVLTEEERVAAKDSLLRALENGPAGHFTTGIFGTKYILESLSQTGNTDKVFNVVNSVSFPGWGYMIDRGATTIWETWEESDNTYSNCHPMFGTVSEWFFRWLGGISPDPGNPGFKSFFLSPSVPEELSFVKCNYFSPNGEIISNWHREQPGKLVFTFSIPENSSAIFVLPGLNIKKLRGKKITKESYTYYDTAIIDSGRIVLQPGTYEIIAEY